MKTQVIKSNNTFIALDVGIVKNISPKLILIDYDGTIAPKSAPDMFEEALDKINELKKITNNIAIISNKLDQSLVKKAGNYLQVEKVYTPRGLHGIKPFKKMFNQAIKDVDAKASETILIGDRYYSDLLGAVISRLKAVILVKTEK